MSQHYDVIVIGGGPAGLMASIAASRAGAHVLLLDKGDKLGRKLGISGGGRCNVTNAKPLDEFIHHIPGNGRFMHSALSQFGNQDIIAFFENLGIALKEEDRGRMFPVSDRAKTVVDALVRASRQSGVHHITNTPVDRLLIVPEPARVTGVVTRKGTTYTADSVVICSGGKSVPQTGSTGDGYAWAMQAGHTITTLYPTEVPIRLSNSWIHNKSLMGLSLRSVTCTVWDERNKPIVTHEGDLIITHYGISGPIALRCSQYVVKQLWKPSVQRVSLTIDLFPQQTSEQIATTIRTLVQAEVKKALRNSLRSFMQERLLNHLFEQAAVDGDADGHQLSNTSIAQLTLLMKKLPLEAIGTLSLDEAFVTGGGVELKHVNPGTLASRICDGLYFAGEVLDLHGYTGGFNISIAFSTGHVAGTHAAYHALALRH